MKHVHQEEDSQRYWGVEREGCAASNTNDSKTKTLVTMIFFDVQIKMNENLKKKYGTLQNIVKK